VVSFSARSRVPIRPQRQQTQNPLQELLGNVLVAVSTPLGGGVKTAEHATETDQQEPVVP